MAHQTVEKPSSLLKQAAIQIGAGGSAGFVEVCVMHPMDLVKTRFQLQVKTARVDPLYYTGKYRSLTDESSSPKTFHDFASPLLDCFRRHTRLHD